MAGFSFRARWLSLKNAVRGLMCLARTEHNLRIHLTAALAAVILGIICGISRSEWLVIVLCMGMVLLAEVFLLPPSRHL